MFSYEQVQSLNRLELLVYKYVISHPKAIRQMTIRELAAQIHVSTTTIFRFLKKTGYTGFSEFKYALKQRPTAAKVALPSVQPAATNQLAAVAQVVSTVTTLIFFGVGTSAALAQYGAQVFARHDFYTLTITASVAPRLCAHPDLTDTLLILLSVSGETSAVLRQAEYYKQNGALVLALTANANSTLAQIADLKLCYTLPQEQQLLTQLPVLYLLEQLLLTTSQTNQVLVK